MVRLRTGPISGSFFRTIQILDRFAGFVSISLCECKLSPTGLLERTGAYQYKIALAHGRVKGAYCIKFASGQLSKHVNVRPQASRPWYPIVYEA